MANSIFIDTSGWMCLVDGDDPRSPQANVLYQQAILQKSLILTSNYVIAELIALLETRKIAPRQRQFILIDRIKSTTGISIIHIDAATDEEAWQLLKNRPDKAWSLVDATSFVVMQRLNITAALTTDHHFTQAGFTRLPA